MDQPLPQPEAEPRVVYPSPPNVYWAVLFAAQFIIAILAIVFTPKPWWTLASNLAVDAWIIYLCLWIRKLEPAAMSIFFCAAYVALQLVFTVPYGPQPMNQSLTIFGGILASLAVVIWFVTTYVVRAELHYHYNVREPIGLYLSGVMTFFFSFLYFQYHLYKIAQLRESYGDRIFYYQGGAPLDLPESES
jgi:hypothetical protein